MDVIVTIKNYIDKMVDSVNGMKVLLLDDETTSIVSSSVTQSHLLTKEVYLVDRIDRQDSEKMRHLKCICFLRPCQESFQSLLEEIKLRRFGEYYLVFSNIIPKHYIEKLAEIDISESIKEVQEFFGDYCSVNSDLFSLNLNSLKYPIYQDNYNTSQLNWNNKTFSRSLECLTSICLSLKKKPIIRYEKSSNLTKELAFELKNQIEQENLLFKFPTTEDTSLLLILDRKSDPITPLLTQWTYQAMIHELLTINNGRVDMSKCKDQPKDLQEIVLNIDQDPFYKKNMFLNFGDLGVNIKSYVDEYQQKTKGNMHIESISDMKRFVEEYPEFRKLSGNVTKHVNLVGELSRLIETNKLLEVSQLEQSLACNESHNSDLKALISIIEDPKVKSINKLKLTILYSIKYEKHSNNSLKQLISALKKQGLMESELSLITKTLKHCGFESRQNDLFGNEINFNWGKNVFKGLKGVENVYTQHTPYLNEILESATKGKLKDTSYPFASNKQNSQNSQNTRSNNPSDIIVFIVGGCTYAEARAINQFKDNNPGVRIVLGGTNIINSEGFLKHIESIGN
ncbi:Sec1-like protein [Conidiobolus coronatus NRRL 28638]|uniref:Vacuolar protein sorting-associated protein 45 n=1 Tax=Conidiobolus coronatus (strain ATCC 28846 / CBS 209.66 / NRRL 28638) TaxID=796925 RepID=A0A137PIS8_CONC2|nr:Sec1-like protein [Conidiobolus coronatus NRRL 28638]|eukprot:KXN74885.1 Sec1-like protein [Conidiobolus coronatus NRRL 28638]